MGMFDELRCYYPLPISGFEDRTFQTKDTPAQYLDQYEIREDGTLWHEAYDIEDHSNPYLGGLDGIAGCMNRVNKRWVQEKITGEICFYGFPTGDHHDGGWVEFSAYFIDGKLKELVLIENKPPLPPPPEE